MNKFDTNSAKYIGLLMLLCLVFIIIVAHAYTYIPQKDNHNDVIRENVLNNDMRQDMPSEVNPPEEEENSDEEEIKTSENEQDEQDLRQEKKSNYNKLEPLTPIKDDGLVKSDVSDASADSVEKVFANANNLRANNDLTSAISEYEKAISMSENVSLKAQCYENIAEIYAYSRRYGSAMAAAQKAYNLEPSVSRDVLLARLYYKTGNVDKANYRMNNVLRSEFTQK